MSPLLLLWYARDKLERVEAAAAIPTEPNTALQSRICPPRASRVVIPNGPYPPAVPGFVTPDMEMVLSVPAVHVNPLTTTTYPEDEPSRDAPVGMVTVGVPTVKPVGKVISATPAVRAVSALKLKETVTLWLTLFLLSSIELFIHPTIGCLMRPDVSD